MVEMVLIMLVADVLTVLAIVFGVKSAYKMSRAKSAAVYLDRESVTYYQKSDTYIRTYVTKVPVPKRK